MKSSIHFCRSQIITLRHLIVDGSPTLMISLGICMMWLISPFVLAQEAQNQLTNDKYEALEHKIHELFDEIEALKKSGWGRENVEESIIEDRFSFGGYGELHANFTEGKSGDQFDIHRLVFYLGYEFNDWIRFNSETEIEHAYVSSGSGGELSLEQAYVDFLINDSINVRAGRILTPLGIVNKKHEPPSFNGVERPSFDKYIIPTTWSSDGIGIFGRLCPSIKYEAYVSNGLDGSQFDAINGIRGGRNKERPSLNEPAFMGRLDYFPFAEGGGSGQMLRFGVSSYYGGLDNGNKGNDPGVKGDILIYSSDFEYTVSKLDLRGAIAFEKIDGARKIGNGTAEEIFGWNLEAGYHIFPESWKTGKFSKSDAVFFVRYDDFDTQHKMPSGILKDPAGVRKEWTLGLTFYMTPSIVVKADYQIRDDDTHDGLPEMFNLGLGWQF